MNPQSLRGYITIDTAEQFGAHQVVTVGRAQLETGVHFVSGARQLTAAWRYHLEQSRDEPVFRRWWRRRIGEAEDVAHAAPHFTGQKRRAQ